LAPVLVASAARPNRFPRAVHHPPCPGAVHHPI